MAQVSLTIVKSGALLLETPTPKSLNSLWFGQMDATTEVSGANTVIEYFKSGPAGGSFIKFFVSETVAEIEALINGASPALTNRTAVAINATATMAEGDLAKGYITSTSAAATAITTRTFAQIVAELGAGAGSTFDFVINNISGANTVTLTPGANITASSALTGGNDMTLAAGEIGVFKLTFGAATAIVSRIV